MIQDGRVEVGEGERLVPGPSLSYSSEPCSEGMSAYEQVMSEETGFDAVSAQQCSVDIYCLGAIPCTLFLVMYSSVAGDESLSACLVGMYVRVLSSPPPGHPPSC